MMNLVANDRIAETRDFSGQFVVFPTGSASQKSEHNSLSRLSREQLAAFLEAETRKPEAAQVSAPRAEPIPPTAEKGLAAGVLKQAAYDLRRFRDATKSANRELYLDAHSWITAYDFSWPYSFMNVCKLLDLCPEIVREDLLADASLGSLHYWIRRANRFSRKLGTSFARVFANCGNPGSAELRQRAPSF
jgi:hypothetical protein